MNSSDWQERVDRIIAILLIAFAVSTALNLLLFQGFYGRFMPWIVTIAVWIVTVFLILLIRTKPLIERIIAFVSEYFISPLMISPIYLIIGNVRNLHLMKGIHNTTSALHESDAVNSRLLKDIHKTTIAMQESALFGRIAELRNPKIRDYYIVYTHKEGHPESGNLENYRIAGFPVDESQMIMRLWYFVTNNLYLDWSNIKPVCGCLFKKDSDRDRICEGSFSIIGSPKGNSFSGMLMEKLSLIEKTHVLERSRRYMMKLDEGNQKHCYVEENGNKYHPDLINPNIPPSRDVVLKDYGLVMKLPSILNKAEAHDGHIILFFAGCKVGGQSGITEWFFAPDNLAELAIKYNAKYFQIFLEVHYGYVHQANPKIIDTNILWEEEIKYKPVGNGG